MQDFTRKMVVVVRKDLPSWQVLNAVGHIAAYLGNKLDQPFDTGEFFVTSDGVRYPRNSQYGIIILSAETREDLGEFLERVRNAGLLHLAFIKEMIEFGDDAKLAEALKGKGDGDGDVECLGVGVFSEKKIIDPLTRQFSLWK
jgi:hypothetical protein